MQCKHLKGMVTVQKSISAQSLSEFKEQLKELIQHAKEPEGIVYVWRTESNIPRMKGSSPVIYIGKAQGSFYNRYVSQISHEANEYWARYSHIIDNYGPISIDLYKSDDPGYTENNFLYQYHQSFMELPPINLRSFNRSKL